MARATVAEADEPAVRRDLSVSLNKVGDVARAQGRLGEAAEAYEEGLSLRRDLLSRYGDTPEAMRDLSVSLNQVGDVARARNDPEQAGSVYRECIAALTRLTTVFPDDPEYPEWTQRIETALEELGQAGEGPVSPSDRDAPSG